jgi:cell division FtsZ-interacting protein ZapD
MGQVDNWIRELDRVEQALQMQIAIIRNTPKPQPKTAGNDWERDSALALKAGRR